MRAGDVGVDAVPVRHVVDEDGELMQRCETAAPTRGRARLRRPAGLVEQTRWLFWLAVLGALALSLIAPVATAGSTAVLLLLVGAALCLVVVWSHRYLSRRSPLWLDGAEAAATATAAAAFPYPPAVFAFVFAALWFRALYGSTRQVLVSCLFVVTGILLAVMVWALLPGRAGVAVMAGSILTALPMMVLIAGVARYLALSLFAREQSQSRDAALVRLGDRLIGLTDAPSIHAEARRCATALCAVTPGLHLVIVLDRGDGHRVIDNIGGIRALPPVLPAESLPIARHGSGGEDGAVQPLRDSSALSAAAGFRGEWLAVPLADVPGGWIILGAPRRVPGEAVVAIQSMTNQIALALRTSEAHHDLTTQANVDTLTGLANRAAFNAALGAAIAASGPGAARRPALMFLDLDDFKVVNDGMGHPAGDELLTHVAARLAEAVRADDLCARLGGDEFAVLLLDAGPDDVVRSGAQRLVDLIAAPVPLRNGTARVGASLGLAYATAGMTGEQLVQHADIAMYAAKAKGKNRVQVFDHSLLQEDGQALFEAELAAAAGAGQLVVHYQPIVAVADGHCVAVEALVRWRHPSRGLLAPAEFIPVAERTGAIIGIGAFVLRQACADAAVWRRTHDGLAIHVNVSAAQLTDRNFIQDVRRAVADSGMVAEQLVLEITESMVLDSHAVREAIDELVSVGVQLAIDDFGTGYSALTTLRTLPLSIVKIDKSFIVGSPADEAVVEAIVQMAGRLGLRIVAEGVERVDQQQFLARVGADAAQGYLHLRPAPAPDLARWLAVQVTGRRGGSNVRKLEPRRSG